MPGTHDHLVQQAADLAPCYAVLHAKRNWPDSLWMRSSTPSVTLTFWE